MSIERIVGGWIIADVINGYRVKSRYYGYTKRQAINLFKAEYYLTAV